MLLNIMQHEREEKRCGTHVLFTVKEVMVCENERGKEPKIQREESFCRHLKSGAGKKRELLESRQARQLSGVLASPCA